jgi:hypothetical protein
MLSSVEGSLVTVDLKAETAGTTADIELKDGVALSNAGFLAAANGGVALPLNVFTVPALTNVFAASIDLVANLGVDFSKMVDLQLLIEYDARFDLKTAITFLKFHLDRKGWKGRCEKREIK